jgi:ubiquitin-protein ligase
LVLAFPRQYPILPPVLRFVSVPYHPNVAQEGRVFFSGVEDGYWGTAKIVDIVEGVRTLLSTPELHEAIRPEVAEQYSTDRPAFDRIARQGSLYENFPANSDWHAFPWTICEDSTL